MITLKEAVKKAVKNIGADKIDSVAYEYPDQWEFGRKEEFDEDDEPVQTTLPSISVNKQTGRIGRFFPPDYSERYLNSGKRINIKKYLN